MRSPLLGAACAASAGLEPSRSGQDEICAPHSLTNREIAGRLVISPKTAGHHVQHVYAKIGVSTRAAAALYAMEHDLVRE